MERKTKQDLVAMVSNFRIDGRVIDVVPYGSGHINDTYASRVKTDGGQTRYVHQRINQGVFKQPANVMENIERVTAHLRKKVIEAGLDPLRRTLNMVRAVDGKTFYRDEYGDFWRTFLFIDGARTYDVVENVEHVYAVSKAFGLFQKMVSDLPGGRLHEAIPNFHNTKWRFGCFLEAMEKDVKNRAKSARSEIDFVVARRDDASALIDLLAKGKAPERTVHNDTKFNNVMIDDQTGEGICVIDLDTVGPGLAMYDFGDSVRLGANPAAEDEKDLSKVRMDLGMFERLARGYLESTRDFLTPVEIEHLAFSAKLMTFECGVRFLADHLAGDVYFKIHRKDHNLDRCRTQFVMVKDMEDNRDQMEAIIEKHRRGCSCPAPPGSR